MSPILREHYFVAQRICDGWSRFAYVLAVELIAILAALFLYRRDPRVRWPAAAALGCLLASQAIFWIWTFPANRATANRTVQPDNWAALRAQWEYSHLAGAAFQMLVLAALVMAVLRCGR